MRSAKTSPIRWCADPRNPRSVTSCDEEMHVGEHLGQVNPKYSDEELPTLDEKELMGDLGPPEALQVK